MLRPTTRRRSLNTAGLLGRMDLQRRRCMSRRTPTANGALITGGISVGGMEIIRIGGRAGASAAVAGMSGDMNIGRAGDDFMDFHIGLRDR